MDDSITYWDMLRYPIQSIQRWLPKQPRDAGLNDLVDSYVAGMRSHIHVMCGIGGILNQTLYEIGPCSFAAFREAEQYHQVIDRWFGPASSLQAMIIWQTAQWRVHKQQIFSPTPNLAQRLRELRLTGVYGRDMQVPFRSFYIRVPREANLQVWDYETKTFYPCIGIFVTADPASVASPANKPFPNYRYFDQTDPVWYMVAIGKGRFMPDIQMFDDAIAHWGLILPPNQTIGSAIKHCYQYVTAKSFKAYGWSESAFYVELMRWVVNFCAYAIDPQVRREVVELYPEARRLKRRLATAKGNKRQKTKDDLRRTKQANHIIIGHDVAPPQPDVSRRSGCKLEIRQYVRGHKKRQPFGPKRTERREIFIAPYWRGPEDGPEGGSRYLLR